MSHVAISRIETGARYGNDTLPRLAAVLGCTPADIGHRTKSVAAEDAA